MTASRAFLGLYLEGAIEPVEELFLEEQRLAALGNGLHFNPLGTALQESLERL